MNEPLQDFAHKLQEHARSVLKEGLERCTERQQYRFKQMYSHNDLDADINDVVDRMEPEKLDWAMKQVQNTLDKK